MGHANNGRDVEDSPHLSHQSLLASPSSSPPQPSHTEPEPEPDLFSSDYFLGQSIHRSVQMH